MQRYVDDYESVPVLILACFVRHRADAHSSDGASVYPACQNLLLAARALGYGGVLTGLHHMADGDLRGLLGIPDNVEVMASITLGRPLGQARSGAPTPAPRVGVRRAVGAAARLGGRPRGRAPHRRRPAAPRALGADGDPAASQYSLGVASHARRHTMRHEDWGNLT